MHTYIHKFRYKHTYKYKQTDKQTYIHTYKYRQTDRQTDIQIHTYKHRHTNIHTDIHTYKHKYKCKCKCKYKNKYIHTYMHTYIQIHTYRYIHMKYDCWSAILRWLRLLVSSLLIEVIAGQQSCACCSAALEAKQFCLSQQIVQSKTAYFWFLPSKCRVVKIR